VYTILTLINDDGGQEARLRVALDLAHALSGHLVCLDMESQLEFANGVGAREFGDGRFLGGAGACLPEGGRQVRDRLRREAVDWELIRADGDQADCIIRRSGLADLIVLDREPDDMPTFDAPSLTSRIAIRSRKPILAVPHGCEGFDVYGRVLVAWDGSPSAMAALTAAVPLLKWSTGVTVLEAGGGAFAVPADEAAAYLARREIHINIRRFPHANGHVLDLLQDSLVANGASYCVMGANGHSSLYEAVFGGVTRRMLATSPVPLLIAH